MSENSENTFISHTPTSIRTKTTSHKKTTLLGSRNMVPGFNTIARTTNSTSTDAQQEQNRSKEDSRIQS